jgi:hypothetical protein
VPTTTLQWRDGADVTLREGPETTRRKRMKARILSLSATESLP